MKSLLFHSMKFRNVAFFFVLLAGWALVLPVQATDMMFWNGTSDWVDNPGNWYYGGQGWDYGYNAGYGWVPGGGENAIIKNGGMAYFDSYSANSFNNLTELWIGDGSNGNTDYPGGTDTGGSGGLYQYEGTLNVYNNLFIGHNNAPGVSTYDMAGGVLNKYGGGSFQISNGGTAVMTMSNDAVANVNGDN